MVSDAAGSPATVTDPGGATITRSWDAAGQLTGVDYSDPDTADVGYSYDAVGRRTAMTDGTGETSFGYDSLDRLRDHTNGRGDSVAYGWDLAGRLARVGYPDGATVERGFDTAGRLEQVTDWSGGVTTFGWDANANLTATALATGAATQRSYDRADRLVDIAHDDAAGDTFLDLAYARDGEGRLTDENATSYATGDYEFAYDARGNRTAKHDADGVAVASRSPERCTLIARGGRTHIHVGPVNHIWLKSSWVPGHEHNSLPSPTVHRSWCACGRGRRRLCECAGLTLGVAALVAQGCL